MVKYSIQIQGYTKSPALGRGTPVAGSGAAVLISATFAAFASTQRFFRPSTVWEVIVALGKLTRLYTKHTDVRL